MSIPWMPWPTMVSPYDGEDPIDRAIRIARFNIDILMHATWLRACAADFPEQAADAYQWLPDDSGESTDRRETMTQSFMEQHGSQWLIRSSDRHPPHTCQPSMHPLSEAPGSVRVDGPAGQPGDLWQCGECQQHWLVVRTRGGDEWRPVTDRRARHLLRRAGPVVPMTAPDAPTPFRLRRRTPEETVAYLTDQLIRTAAENAALAAALDQVTHEARPGYVEDEMGQVCTKPMGLVGFPCRAPLDSREHQTPARVRAELEGP